MSRWTILALLFAAAHRDAGELRRIVRREGPDALRLSLSAATRRERLAAADAAAWSDEPIETLRILAPVLRARERELCTRAARSAEALVLGTPRALLDDVGRDPFAAEAVAREYAAIADDARLGEEVRAMARTVDRRVGETVDAVRRALGGSPAHR